MSDNPSVAPDKLPSVHCDTASGATSRLLQEAAKKRAIREQEEQEQSKFLTDRDNRDKIWNRFVPLAEDFRPRWEKCSQDVEESLKTGDINTTSQRLRQLADLLVEMQHFWTCWHREMLRWRQEGAHPSLGFAADDAEPQWLRYWAWDHYDKTVGYSGDGEEGYRGRRPAVGSNSATDQEYNAQFRKEYDGPIPSISHMLNHHDLVGPTIGKDVRDCSDVLLLMTNIVKWDKQQRDWIPGVDENEVTIFLESMDSVEHIAALLPLSLRIILPGLRYADRELELATVGEHHRNSARRLMYMAEASNLLEYQKRQLVAESTRAEPTTKVIAHEDADSAPTFESITSSFGIPSPREGQPVSFSQIAIWCRDLIEPLSPGFCRDALSRLPGGAKMLEDWANRGVDNSMYDRVERCWEHARRAAALCSGIAPPPALPSMPLLSSDARNFLEALARFCDIVSDAPSQLPTSPPPIGGTPPTGSVLPTSGGGSLSTNLSIIISHGDRNYSREKSDPIIVTDDEDSILLAFLEYKKAMDKRALEEKSGVDNVSRVMKDLFERYDGQFAPCMRMPGKRNSGGHFIRVQEM